ncbi:tRNA1(Val) (adenine(37)-N6)-methyltransferase [Azorhizobium oxalatiphilum]|nr:methyltransferase [Azorhizobium oxalatiphilum]
MTDTPPDLPNTTRDTILGGRVTLHQPRRGHRVGHDAILLAALAPDDTRHLVDLGTGVGAAGLAVLARLPGASAHLVEIDSPTAALARENVAANGVAERCAVVEGDVLRLARPGGPAEPAPDAADLVIANPPFNARAAHQTSPDARRATAHMADGDTLQGWVLAAYRCLAPAGRLALILRPEDLTPLLAALAGRFGAAELLPVHPAPGADAVRLLVRAIKGRRTPPVIRPGLVLADAAGRPSPEAETILRDGTALR